jgi:MoaA/NifB/PqqE/SkfB family radical SAM enzyme
VLVTNGKGLHDDRVLELVGQSVDQVGVSLEGVTPESYARTRKGGDFARLVAALRKLDTDRIRLVLKTIPMRHNLDELPDLIRLAADLGARHVACQHLLSMPGLEAIHDEHAIWDRPERWNEVQAECRELAKGFGITLNWPGPLVEHDAPDADNPLTATGDARERFIDPTTKCYEPWEYARYGPVKSGGCCMIDGPDHRDHDDVLDLWNAPQIRALRATVNDPDQTRWHPRCRTCQRRMR